MSDMPATADVRHVYALATGGRPGTPGYQQAVDRFDRWFQRQQKLAAQAGAARAIRER